MKLTLKDILLIIIIFCGSSIRIFYYAINRSLWLDEAFLSLNIVNRSLPQLLKPLDYSQATPLGFLIGEKIVVGLLGASEYSLRLIPLLSGVISLILIAKVSNQYLKGFAPLLSTSLLSISPKLIYYSSEVKQYSTDVLFGLLILLVFHSLLTNKPSNKNLFLFGIIGSLGIWISHPSLFIFIPCYLVLFWNSIRQNDKKILLFVIIIGLSWILNLGINYLISLRYLSSSSVLVNYWNNGFAPIPPWKDLKWYSLAISEFIKDPAGLTNIYLAIGIFLLGVVSLSINQWRVLIILILPFFLTLAASAIQKYPFQGRLLLFLTPLFFMIISEGINLIYKCIGKLNKSLSVLTTLFLTYLILVSPLINSLNEFVIHPNRGEDIKPVISYITRNRYENDIIYVYYGAVPAFNFYLDEFDIKPSDFIEGKSSRTEPEQYLEEVSQTMINNRVWFVFSHNCSWCVVNEQNYIVDFLNDHGKLELQFSAEGAQTYLYLFKQ